MKHRNVSYTHAKSCYIKEKQSIIMARKAGVEVLMKEIVTIFILPSQMYLSIMLTGEKNPKNIATFT